MAGSDFGGTHKLFIDFPINGASSIVPELIYYKEKLLSQ